MISPTDRGGTHMSDKHIALTRRKVLAGLGTIGVAGAGAGLGTSALFSDEESFTNNSIQAGELDLIVDYYTSRDQGSFGSNSQEGQIGGTGITEYTYDVADVKPGDSGTVAFCPKIVDNPGWLWVGSAGGVTDYENGQTEPEGQIDGTVGGTLDNGTNDGPIAGDLSEEIEVTVSYAESVSYDAAADEITCTNTRELQNPEGYTLAELAKELESGLQLDGNEPNDGDGSTDAYPGSADADDQQGPCLCIEWEVPADVGNEIQSDALELDFQFVTFQERNNTDPSDPSNPFANVTVGTGSGFDHSTIQSAVDAASAGDVVTVAPGTYSESDDVVTVDTEDVFLTSTAGPPSTTFDGRMVASADGVTICGFTVSPPDATGTQVSEAIRVSNSPDGVSIVNNVVDGFSRGDTSGFYGIDGINVFGGTETDPIEDVTVSYNTVKDLQNSVSGGAAGISIQGNVDGATVRDNLVTEVGKEVSSYAFGVTLRGTGNHSKVPRNVDVVDNDVNTILADTTTQYLGVGFGSEADGTNYVFRENTVADVNIGVEIKGAATELTLVDNEFGPIDTSVNGGPALYLGDQSGAADVAPVIAENTFDVAVESGPAVGPYDPTIVPS
jgi:predicted ribosomally synthesized peptide with SipW-like signal peptide